MSDEEARCSPGQGSISSHLSVGVTSGQILKELVIDHEVSPDWDGKTEADNLWSLCTGVHVPA